MSDAERNADPDGDERLDVKLAEDAESVWLCARQRNLDAPPPSLMLAREHAQLEGMLGNLPSLRVEDSWHDEVLRAAIRAHRRSTRGRWTAALLSVAAVVGGAALSRPRPVRGPELELEVRRNQITRGSEPSVGDQLGIIARSDSDSDLRVYYNGVALLARCPGDPRCAYPGGPRNEQILKLSLNAPGEYDVMLVVSTGRAFPGASMDEYLSAVVTAEARFVTRRMHVQ